MGKAGCRFLMQLGRRMAAPLLICALALGTAPAAFAQAAPDYTAGSIVEHFSKLREPHEQKAKTRSVFIGASGFSQSDEVAQDEKFNLLITFEYNSDRLTPAARRNLTSSPAPWSTPLSPMPASWSRGIPTRPARPTITSIYPAAVPPRW